MQAYPHAWAALTGTAKQEGFGALYRGLGLTCVKQVCSTQPGLWPSSAQGASGLLCTKRCLAFLASSIPLHGKGLNRCAVMQAPQQAITFYCYDLLKDILQTEHAKRPVAD